MGSVVGLYIRPDWVEAVELRKGLTAVSVARFGRFPLLSHDSLKLTEGVKGALEAGNIRARDAIVAIPSQEVFLRYFFLPAMPKSEWHSAVKFEARKYVPFKMEELVWDSCLMEQPATRQLGVVFVGVRKEVLNQYVTCIRNAGLRPLAIEAASFSLARAMHYGRRGDDDQQVTIAVDVGSDVAHVAFVKSGVPLLARDVSLMAPTDDRSVEALARSQLVAQQPDVAAESKRRLDHLISELHLSIDYFSREFPNDQMREVLLYGEQLDPGWVDILGHEFHAPVAIGQSMAAIRGANQLVSGWTVAVGLGLRSVRGGGPRINLLQTEAAQPAAAAVKPKRWVGWLIAEAVLATIALIALGAWMSYRLTRVQARVALVQHARAGMKLPYPNTPLKELTAIRERTDRRLALLRRLVRDRLPVTPKLSTLVRVLPEGIWLDHLTYRGVNESSPDVPRLLTVQGFCYRGSSSEELELISQLMQSLRSDAVLFNGFQRAELGTVNKATLDRFTVTSFELQVTGEASHGAL